MFSLVIDSYQYVVKVNKNEKEKAYCVHQTLKGLCCVFQPKRHEAGLQAKKGYDSSLSNVFLLHGGSHEGDKSLKKMVYHVSVKIAWR